MNGTALTLKSTPFAPAEFEVRVKSTVGTLVMLSNVVGIVITPYTQSLNYGFLVVMQSILDIK
jgi:hypothetical protein